ncbi:MAG: hypothetical protein AAGE94_16460 [Acidobacteriota bacterium]
MACRSPDVSALPAGSWPAGVVDGVFDVASEDFASEDFASEGFASEDFASEDFASDGLPADGFETDGFETDGFETDGVLGVEGAPADGVDGVPADGVDGIDGGPGIEGDPADAQPIKVTAAKHARISTIGWDGRWAMVRISCWILSAALRGVGESSPIIQSKIRAMSKCACALPTRPWSVLPRGHAFSIRRRQMGRLEVASRLFL